VAIVAALTALFPPGFLRRRFLPRAAGSGHHCCLGVDRVTRIHCSVLLVLDAAARIVLAIASACHVALLLVCAVLFLSFSLAPSMRRLFLLAATLSPSFGPFV
jgi:hypothetical protein